MVQQEYDDEAALVSYMVEFNQEVETILLILPLLLESRLAMNVSQYFRSSYTIESEGYKRESTLYKALPTGIDNVLVEIGRH